MDRTSIMPGAMTQGFAPPPTKYGPQAPAQAKASPVVHGRRHVPPPTAFGPQAPAQAKAPPAVRGHHPAPPPTAFGPQAPAQAKAPPAVRGHHHAPPPTAFGAQAPAQAKAPPAARGHHHAPPPTAFGPQAPAQAKAPPAVRGMNLAPPPTRFAPAASMQPTIKAGGAGFVVDGRIDGHDCAENLRALSAKIRARAAGGAGLAATAGNNEYETNLLTTYGGGGAAEFISGNLKANGLAICHKNSSEQVQSIVVGAAMSGNWADVSLLVDGIAPIAWDAAPAAGGDFDQYSAVVTARHAAAAAALALYSAGTVPTAGGLNELSFAVANSPANLFIGRSTVNSSISSRGDFNTIPLAGGASAPTAAGAPALVRARSVESEQVQTSVAAIGGDLAPIAHGEAFNAGTRRDNWAGAFPSPAAGSTYQLNMSSSADLGATGTGFVAWN